MMTVTSTIAGLLPILWGSGAGASVMKRVAAPMVGGMMSSPVLTLVVIPAIYSLWKERGVQSGQGRRRRGSATAPVRSENWARVTSYLE